MPRHIYALALGIFAMVTSDFAVAGLMPELAADLDVGIPLLGYLVTAFSLAMALGGPILALLLSRLDQRHAILALFVVFLLGNVAAAASPSYDVLFAARIVTGAAAGAFFGVAVTVASTSTTPALRGKAIAAVLLGMTIGLTLGLPLSTWVGGHLGWRGAFVGIGALALFAAVVSAALVPRGIKDAHDAPSLKQDLQPLRSSRLWVALVTSMVTMGATFAAFSYYTPILQSSSGIASGLIPLVLLGYGVANIIGNTIVGRLAISYTFPVLIVGTGLNAVLLLGFALGAQNAWIAVTATVATGFVGVTMNAALVARIHQEAPSTTLVNTVHTSMITIGVALGSTLGALGIQLVDNRAPLWVGSAMALIAVLAMLPFRSKSRPEKIEEIGRLKQLTS